MMGKQQPWTIDQAREPGWLAGLSHRTSYPIPPHPILAPFLVDMTVCGVPERVWDNRSKQADDEQKTPLDKVINGVSRVPGEG